MSDLYEYQAIDGSSKGPVDLVLLLRARNLGRLSNRTLVRKVPVLKQHAALFRCQRMMLRNQLYDLRSQPRNQRRGKLQYAPYLLFHD